MKQLRTLCLAGLITVSFAAVCHAEVTTKVPVKDYMPQVKTLYVDDDFNDQQSETPQVSTAYANPVKKYANQAVAVASETDGNKFLELNSTKGFIYPVARETIGKKKLTISFDVQTGELGKMYLEIGRGGTNQDYLTKFLTVNVWKTGGTVDFICPDGTTTTKSAQFAAFQADKWTNITMTFERKKQADGTYVAEITELFVAGKQIGLGTAAGAPIRADWWTGSACTEGTLAIRSTNKGNRIDNVLIYEPEDRKTETIVTKSSYMPEIKTLIADDGFENRPADQKANTEVTYTIPHPVTIGQESSKDGSVKEKSDGADIRRDNLGNQYLELGRDWNMSPYAPGANVDRLAISFEMGQTKDDKKSTGKIYIGNSPVFTFEMYAKKGGMNLLYDADGGNATSSSNLKSLFKPDRDMHKFEFVLRREANADGGYDVFMENMYLDDTEVSALRGKKFKDIDWWSSKVHSFRMFSRIPNVNVDNILVYEPITDEEVHALVTSFPEIKGDIAENSSVTASATVTNTSGADKKVLGALAIYEDGILKNIKMQEFVIPNGTKESLFTSDPIVCQNISSEKAYGVKAFAWSDMVSVTGD